MKRINISFPQCRRNSQYKGPNNLLRMWNIIYIQGVPGGM